MGSMYNFLVLILHNTMDEQNLSKSQKEKKKKPKKPTPSKYNLRLFEYSLQNASSSVKSGK